MLISVKELYTVEIIMATKQEKAEATPKHVLCENAVKHDLRGVSPSISVNKEGCVIMVYQHWKPGLKGISHGIYYCQGTLKDEKITWGVEQTLETEGCSAPKVSISENGTVVLVYGKGTRCYYRTGSVQKSGVSWDPEQMIDEGNQPSVDIAENRVVIAFISNNHGYARVGAIDLSAKRIVWKEDKFELTPDKIDDLAVAINQNKDVIVAYRTGLMKSMVHCKYGKIEGGQVVFVGSGEEREIKGYYPTVSLNKNGRVLVAFEQLSPLRKILAQCGEVKSAGGGGIQWRDAPPDGIDNGHRPSVSLTDKGEFVEIHESHLPVVDQSMFYRIGQLL